MTPRALLLLSFFSLSACGGGITDPPDIDLGPAPTMTVLSEPWNNVQRGTRAVARVRLASPAGALKYSIIAYEYLETNQTVAINTGTATDADGVAELGFTTTRVGPFTIKAWYSECARYGHFSCDKTVVRATMTITGTTVGG